MKILVTNDDGINSEGLLLLIKIAKRYGEVICIAPMEEQSGKSHCIVIKEPFLYKKVEDIIDDVKTYVVDSTPADCVRIAQYYLMEDFDIVLSGVNNGYNLGEDILYSGTVGAASEAILCGKKAIAFSATRNSFKNIEDELEKVFEFFNENKLLDVHNFWNINICNTPLGIKFTTQGNTNFNAYYEEINNDKLFSRGGPDLSIDNDKTSDVFAIYNNYISITPLTINRTNLEIFNKLNNK